MLRLALLVMLLLAPALPVSAQEEPPRDEGLGAPPARKGRTLTFPTPEGWKVAPLREGERQAFYVEPAALPRAHEAEEPAPKEPEPKPITLRVSVYRVDPPGRERPVAEHLARWVRQFEGADGKPLSPEGLKPQALEEAPHPTQLVRLEGTYVAPRAPGEEAPQRRPGWAGLYAHVAAPDGAYTVVVVGPRAAVRRLAPGLRRLLRSAETAVGETEDPREHEGEEGERGGGAPGK